MPPERTARELGLPLQFGERLHTGGSQRDARLRSNHLGARLRL